MERPRPASLSFGMLRRIAEAASGVREKDVWFVVHEDEDASGKPVRRLRSFDRKPEEGADYPPGAVVIPVAAERDDVPPPPPLRPTWGRLGMSPERSVDLMAVMVTVDGRAIPADAVFWSEAAVEKFLVPYYASVAGPDAAETVASLLSILHRAPPRAAGDRAASGAEDGSADAAAGTAFAVVHIPTSEYIAAESLGADLMAAAIDPGGEPTLLSPEDLEKLRRDLGWYG